VTDSWPEHHHDACAGPCNFAPMLRTAEMKCIYYTRKINNIANSFEGGGWGGWVSDWEPISIYCTGEYNIYQTKYSTKCSGRELHVLYF